MDESRLEAKHGKLDYIGILRMKRKLGYLHTKRVQMSLTHRVRISVMGQTHRTHNEMNGCSRVKTEPLQGARPKWNKGERPPVITDWTGVLDLEDTGGVGGWNVEHHGAPTPLLPLERQWQILQEAEGSSRTWGPTGSWASVTPRKDTSSTSDLYGCPDKGRRFGPTG